MSIQKSPEAFRTISEAAEIVELPAHVLRFWESKFIQIKPIKRAGGRRFYRPSDITLLFGIKKLLHVEGMTIVGVKRLIKERGIKYVINIGNEEKKEERSSRKLPSLKEKYLSIEKQLIEFRICDYSKLTDVQEKLLSLREKISGRIK